MFHHGNKVCFALPRSRPDVMLCTNISELWNSLLAQKFSSVLWNRDINIHHISVGSGWSRRCSGNGGCGSFGFFGLVAVVAVAVVVVVKSWWHIHCGTWYRNWSDKHWSEKIVQD